MGLDVKIFFRLTNSIWKPQKEDYTFLYLNFQTITIQVNPNFIVPVHKKNENTFSLNFTKNSVSNVEINS